MRRRLLQGICFLAAIGALIWLLDRIGWQTIGAAMARVGWHGAALLGSFSLIETVLDAAALWIVIGIAKLRLGFAVGVNGAGSLLNLLLPWESGEVLKGGLLRTYAGSEAAISATVIWNYIFKITRPTVSLLVALGAWLLCRDVSPSIMRLILIANVLAFLPYVVLRILIRFGAATGMVKLLRMIPGIRRHPGKWLELARNIDRNVRQFWRERPTDYIKVFVLQVVARCTGWLSIYSGFKLAGLPYSFGQALLVYATMNVAELVIAALPARLGVSEGTAFVMFKFLGLDPAMGLTVYVILRVRTIAISALMSPLAFLNWQPRSVPAQPPASTQPTPGATG